MGNGFSVAEHLNAFSTIVTQLISIGVNMDEEDHCITLSFYFPSSWDNLIIAIGRIVKKNWLLMRLWLLYYQKR